MSAVWKFTISNHAGTEIKVPIDATALCAKFQGNQLCVWYLLDQDKPTRGRVLEVFGSGWNFDACGMQYVDTVLVHGGAQVWHVFERHV